MTLYGAALAASRLRDFTGASAQLVKLSALTKNDAAAGRLYRLLAAELALAADDVPQASTHLSVHNTVLKTLAATSADNAAGTGVKTGRPEVILGASVAIRAGKAADAAEQLQAWVASHPRDAQAWQLLSTAHAALGKNLRAIRADAESQVARLDYAAAADRFKAAQELARDLARKGQADHFEASIIDSRSRQVALLLRDQALER